MFNDDKKDIIIRNWIIAITAFIFWIVVSGVSSPLFDTREWNEPIAKKYEYVIDAFKTIGLFLGGIVGGINIFFAAKRAYAMEQSAKAANESAIAANKNAEIALKNVKISEDKQITERFAKAIEQLASDKIEVRLGAIYTLERIAKDSEKDQWTIMEVLTAFVRENTPVKKYEKSQDKKPLIDYWINIQQEEEIKELPKLRLDIQECLTVIGRRKYEDPKNTILDLSDVNISKANLEGANFEGVNLSRVNLTGAKLRGINLQKANLQFAEFEGAILEGANLQGSMLFAANFYGAILEGANLQGSELIYAKLKGANLKGAIMPDGKIHD